MTIYGVNITAFLLSEHVLLILLKKALLAAICRIGESPGLACILDRLVLREQLLKHFIAVTLVRATHEAEVGVWLSRLVR